MSATVAEWMRLIPVLFRMFSFQNIKKHKLLCTGMSPKGASIYLPAPSPVADCRGRNKREQVNIKIYEIYIFLIIGKKA